MPKAVMLLATIVLLSAPAGQSQTSTQYDKGTPPQHAVGVSSFGSYVSTDLGTINISNGALNFKIPMGSVGGRGGLSVPLSLNYSSKVWSASLDTDIERESGTEQSVAYADYDRGLFEGSNLQSIIGAGWSIAGWPSLDAKRVLIGRITSGPNVGCYNYVLTRLTLYLPDRGEIELRDDASDGAPLPTNCSGTAASRGTRWHATDGSGIIFINDIDNGAAQWPAPNLSGVVITADGTRIRVGENGTITDRNGNRITGLTDQLGRTVTVQHYVPDPENSSVTLRVLVTLPGYGGPRYYKIKTGIMNANYRGDFVNTPTPVISGDWDPEGWGYTSSGNPTRLFLKSYGLYAQRIDDLEVLTELVLPDGRSLKFKYNAFGEVAEVELPTGGRIQYDYGYSASLPTGNSPLWETNTNGGGSGILSDVKFVDRTVKERRTYPDGVSLEGKWNYGYGSTSTSITARSSSGALMSDTIHYFLAAGRYSEYSNVPGNHDGTHYTLWSTGVQWRVESRDASGAIISAVEQDWTQRAPVSWSTYNQEQPANDNRVNQSRKYLETGAFAKAETVYDLVNNPVEVKEYNFDQSLKRRSVTSYSSTNSVNGTNYAADSIRLIRLPLQHSVFDGAGVEQARTLYEYDIYAADGNHDALLSYPSITGHDTANYGPLKTARGNVTRIANWVKATDSYLESYARYDIAGNVVSTKDPRGYVSSVSFADDFGNGSNPGGGMQGTNGSTYALPTLITTPPPTPGAPVHTARSQYDFATGLLTGFKARNGTITQTLYNDPYNRPTMVKSALGISGVEHHAAIYYAPATTPYGITLTKNDVLTTRDQNTLGDAVLRSWTKTDGFGRTVESWSRDPQGDVKIHTIYDAFGRARQVSSPFRPSSESSAYTTTTFDLAGRVISVMTPDNAVVNTSYSGASVTVTDQAGKQRKTVTDALGRLTQVHEDPNGQNYVTSYTYDTLDNLTSVIQGSQSRYFTYDSLSRLTRARNPEQEANPALNFGDPLTGNSQWSNAYEYDNNGNLTQKIDARNIVTTIAYDGLNRPTTKLYRVNGQPDPNTGDVQYLYDNAANGKGRLWLTLTFGNSPFQTAVGSYDALGRVTQLYRLFGNGSGGWYPAYEVGASYNLAGAVTSMSYPSGRAITNSFDNAGRLSSFTGYLGDGIQRTYASGLTYASFGGMTQEQFGTNTPLYNKRHYNVRGQLYDVRVSTAPWATDEWNWNRGAVVNYYGGAAWGQSSPANNGNLTMQQHWAPLNESTSQYAYTQQSYNYDALNRLSSASEVHGNQSSQSGTDYVQAYEYDRYGNRLINQASTWGPVPKPNFGVNTSNNRLTAPAGSTMSYDAAGNLIFDNSDGFGGTRTYDAENRMRQAWANEQWQTYIYDADGNRVRRTVNGTETWEVYGIGGELLAEYPANASPANPKKEYGYRNGELLITAEAGAGGSSTNVALNKLTTQSSEGWGGAAGRAVDGNNSGNWYDNSVTHTQSDNQAWWQVDLGATFSVTSVELWNRTDCCGDRLTNFNVILLDASQATVNSVNHPGQVGVSTTVTINGNARYVKVQLVGTNYLSLAEVRVWGTSGGSAAKVKWLVNDHLGTPRMVFDQSGSLTITDQNGNYVSGVTRHDYLPFGEELFGGPPSSPGVGGRTTTVGYSPGDNVRQKFTSKERDDETGLDYFGARYYASMQGRFTGVDPIILGGISRLNDPQRLNLYGHARQNPLKFIDSDGRDITPTNAQSAAQLRADLDKMLTAAEAANVTIEAGKNVSLVDANAINPTDASPAYQKLLIAIAPGVQRYYTSVAANTEVTTRDGHTINVEDGKAVFEGGTRADGKDATVIEIFVPPTDGPPIWGPNDSTIGLPRYIITGHEALGHGTCGTGRCAVAIENQIRDSLGLPLRDGSDHEKLRHEKGKLRPAPAEANVVGPPALIETREININTRPIPMRPRKPGHE